jgi:hypothetical protein
MGKLFILFAGVIILVALAIHIFDNAVKPKIVVFREGAYECVTLRGSGGASCYRVEQ